MYVGKTADGRSVVCAGRNRSCKVCLKMEIEKSRNGYYTLTFFNKHHKDEKEIYKDFSTVGHVCKIVQNFQRVFIRFREKEEAERALKKFGKMYDVDMAKNNKNSDSQSTEGVNNVNHVNHNSHLNHIYNHRLSEPGKPLPELPAFTRSMEKLTCSGSVFHLILGNLPKSYTIKDVHSLVGEAKPICINQMDETRVFNIRFCHIVLDTMENLSYLIDKLNGFTLCEEKLIAAEAKDLMEWKKLNA